MNNFIDMFHDCAVYIADEKTLKICYASSLLKKYFPDANEGACASDILPSALLPSDPIGETRYIRYRFRDGSVHSLEASSSKMLLDGKNMVAVRIFVGGNTLNMNNDTVVFDTLCKTFLAIYVLNTENKTLHSVMQSKEDENYICDFASQSYAEVINNFAENYIHPQDKGRYIYELNIDYILEALSHSDKISREYRRKIAGEYRQVSYEISAYDFDRKTIVIAVEDINDKHKERLENQKVNMLLSAAVSNKYVFAAYINLTRNSFERLTLSNLAQRSDKVNYSSFDESVETMAADVYPEDRDKYIKTFCRKNLLERFSAGANTVYLEYRASSGKGYKWVSTTAVNLTDISDEDITEITLTQLIENRKRNEIKNAEDHATMAALSRKYVGAYFANLSEETIRPLRIRGGYEDFVQSNMPAKSFGEVIFEYAHTYIAESYRDQVIKKLDAKDLLRRFISGEDEIDLVYKYNDGSWMEMSVVKSDSFSTDMPYIVLGIKCIDEQMVENIDEMASQIAVSRTYSAALSVSADLSFFHCIHLDKKYFSIPKRGEFALLDDTIKEVTDKVNYEKIMSMIRKCVLDSEIISDDVEIKSQSGFLHSFNIVCTNIAVFGERNIIILVKNTDMEKSRMRALSDALAFSANANMAKNEFLKDSAQKLSNPMTSISGLSSLALASIGDNRKVTDYLCRISSLASESEKILSESLDMSKLKSANVSVNSNPFVLEDLFSEVIGIVSGRLKQKSQTLEITPGNIVHEYLDGDLNRYIQIITTTILRVSDCTEPGKKIKFKVEELQDFVVLDGYSKYRFIYEGSEDTVSRVFTEFNDEDLSMEIVKNLLQMIGGEVIVSENSLILEFTTKLQDVERLSGVDFEGKYVLIVDHNKAECEALSVTLQALGIDSTYIFDPKEIASEIFDFKQNGFEYSAVIIDNSLDKAQETAEFINDITNGSVAIVLLDSNVISEPKKSNVYFLQKPVFNTKLKKVLLDIINDRNNKNSVGLSSVFKNVRVLFAEDNLLNLNVAAELFEIMGISITYAHNGEEALELFNGEDKFDIVFLDESMPKLSGAQVAERIRKADAEVPLIAVDNNVFSKPPQPVDFADEHIAKPLNVMKLYSVLKKYVK